MSAASGDIMEIAKKYRDDPVVKYILSLITNYYGGMKIDVARFSHLKDIIEKCMIPGTGFSFSNTNLVENSLDKSMAICLELTGVLAVYLRDRYGEKIEY